MDFSYLCIISLYSILVIEWMKIITKSTANKKVKQSKFLKNDRNKNISFIYIGRINLLIKIT